MSVTEAARMLKPTDVHRCVTEPPHLLMLILDKSSDGEMKSSVG
ncbi:hypothetical protein [Thalassobium sp. R2A62]|nr:hypothetical protein [Thalassobium sp. R2A62]EET47468.1 hypothetical protein TR2A62_2776 [Thalassobium sp. R2A62]MDG2453516.1 hypothetical protein [Paracoccaceae bacterium]